MSSKVLGWRTRIYIPYTSTYPDVLNTIVWAVPFKVSESDIQFGFAYWHKLESMREEWSTYDMVGVVAVEQCSPAFITHMSKTLEDDTLLKYGYHQFTMGGISRKYSPLFQRVLAKHCTPPLSSNTSHNIYNSWICSSIRMIRFIDWFSTKLTPFINTNPIKFDEMVTIGDSMKVNDEAAPYTFITKMLVEKLIMGYFAIDPIDKKMNTFYTNDYDRESKRLAQHEQLKLKFIKSVETPPKPVQKQAAKPVQKQAATPLPETPTPVPHMIERMQEEYRAAQAEREKIEAEEFAARSILTEEMMKKAIKEAELLATLQKTMVIKSTKGTTVTSELASAEADAIRKKIDEEIHLERLQAEAQTEEYRRSIDNELAALRQKAEEDMVSSIRTAELDSIRQLQQQTNSSVIRIREETDHKVATAKATLDREKKALERAKLMRLELEKSRDAAIREAEDTVQQMRAIEKETRKYAHLLEQANMRQKAEEDMVSSIRTAELDSIRQPQQQTNSSVIRIREETEHKVATAKATLDREKKALERAKLMRLELEKSRDAAIREAEDTVQQMRAIEKETRKYAHLLEQANSSRLRYEAERAMLVKQIEVEMTFVRSSIEQMETLTREKEEHIRISRKEADEKMRKALAKAEEEAAESRKQTEFEVLAERQRRENKLRDEIRQKENNYLTEKRREDAIVEAEIKARRAEYLQQKKLEDERILNELKEQELEQVRERDRQLEQFAIEKRKSDEEYAQNRVALLEKLQVEHERALAEVKVATAGAEEKCNELNDTLTQSRSKKDRIVAHMKEIMAELNATTITSTKLEETMFSMRLRISDMTETIERLTHDTQAIQPKLDQLNATRLTSLEEYEVYKHRLEELTVETDAALAKLAEIEKEANEKQTQRQHVEQKHREMLDQIHANTVAISVAEHTIASIRSNMSSLIISKETAEQTILEMRIHLEEHTDKYEECEAMRKSVNEELASTLATLTSEKAKLANAERNLSERKSQLQTTEGLLEVLRLEYDRNTYLHEEAQLKYSAMTERNAEIEQNIRQISDTFKMLDQSYTEMITMNHTMTAQQTEKRTRNAAENKLLVEKRAELAELEKAYSSDHDMRKMTEETYRITIAERAAAVVYHKQMEENTLTCRKEKSELEQKTATIVSSLSSIEHELLTLRADIWEKETTLAKLNAEKQAALLKKAEVTAAIVCSKFDERIRISLAEKANAKRRALEEQQEFLNAQSQHAQLNLNMVDKAAQARKRALEEALAARTHIEQNPVRIYILCHTAERFEKATSIYSRYPWARPILMKYQDCTFENAVWKQLYEIRDEWYNYKMVGTMSFSAYNKLDMLNVDRIVKDPNTWAAGFYHFMRTETPISNKNHPHLVEIMTESCRVLELPVPPENFCNYWITSSEKMIQFLIWFEERAYPTVMNHPLIMTDSTYPGSLSKDKLLTLCGVPYYPHTPFVFERLFLSYFASLK